MKLTQNQYHGRENDHVKMPKIPGSTYLSTDTGSSFMVNDDEQIVRREESALKSMLLQNNYLTDDTSYAMEIDVTKTNTASGFNSNIYGIRNYTKSDSPQTVVNIGGTWSKAEHTGLGRTYYITGATNRAYHTGTGDSNSIAGTYSQGYVGGDGVGAHSYVVGLNNETKLDNPNATVRYLQSQHVTTNLSAGEVTDNLQVMLLDIDYEGGTLSGDLDYIKIMNDVLPTTTGVSRAINSESVLPSVFAGSMQVAGFTNTSVAEHADNAAAIAGGLASGTHYRTGDLLKIVH